MSDVKVARRASERLKLNWRKFEGVFHVLPKVLLIGVQKGGTTSLYNALAQHPLVLPSRKKEPHFFAIHYDRGEGWYRSFYPNLLRARRTPGSVAIDASTETIYHPYAPARVARHIPDAKLIAVLRDPVERAWSHYHHIRRLTVPPRETLPFEQAVWLEEERMRDFWRTVARDPLHKERILDHFTYLSRGYYAQQLRRWWEHFPQEQLLVLSSEELFGDPEGSLARVLDFLELPQHDGIALPHDNKAASKPTRVPAEIRQRLEQHFAPHNEELYELLGRDFGW